jgi:NAD(P)-dependent dehydrogenase (short-subunit alcohol dehydrogenase family)
MGRYIVTGANRGLGLEFVQQLLGRGERVIAACRKPAQAQALNVLAGNYPGHLHMLPLDVASEKSIHEFAREVPLVADNFDVLINNAGMLVVGEHFGNIAMKTLADSFAVNAAAPLLLTQALVPLLAAPGGKVINISSQMGSIADADSFRSVSYSMSKAALNMATRRLGVELAPRGIVIAAYHPGWVQTDMGGANATSDAKTSVDALLKQIERLDAALSGGFYDRDGKVFPW